jgi:hypothetical protein
MRSRRHLPAIVTRERSVCGPCRKHSKSVADRCCRSMPKNSRFLAFF